MKLPRNNSIPVNNTPELAQWFLERGEDLKGEGFCWIVYSIAALFVQPPLAILSIPIGVTIGIWTRRTGKRYVEMGEAMNEAAGRENYMRPTGMPSNRFLRGWANGPDTRFYPVMDHPPVQPVWA